MGYDDVIPLLGDFGKYQRGIYFLLCLPAIICAFHKLANVFLHAKPNYRCQLPNELANASFFLEPETLNASFPWHETNQRYSNCSMFSANQTEIDCSSYIYDASKYQSTTVKEWDLVCGDGYKRSLGDAVFMVGVMLGSIGFGELSDRYGRKLIFFISLVIQVIFGLLAAVAPEYWSYTLARAVVGATTSGVFLVAYVIAMEMVGPGKRMIAGTVCQMFFSLGYMLTTVFAYFIHDWRYLQGALTLPGVLFFSYWWFIPESARWLITKNRVKEAKDLIQIAAKANKVTISDEQLDTLLQSDVKKAEDQQQSTGPKPSVLDIFKHPNLRKRSLVIFFDWFCNSLTYYGLSWNSSNLGGNDYLNFVISGAVEIPAYIFVMMTINRWGRKCILCGCMVTAGVALLLTMAVPSNQPTLVVALAMIGKLAITASYGTVYIFSVEQFPTVIRNAGLGAGSTAARMGSVIAPFINALSEYSQLFPLLIFGGLSLAGGCMSLLLPETLNKQLPETIEDGERFGRETDPPASKEEIEALKVIEKNGTLHQNGDV